MGWLSDLGKGAVSPLWLAADKMGTSDTTVHQGPLRTPEQVTAQQRLLQYGQTGRLGDYQAGEAYTGSLGDFDMTELEKLSQGTLGNLLQSGMPQGLSQGNQVLTDLLTTEKYNPLQSGGAYDAMQGTIDRQIRDAETAAKRSSAYAGNLYSSDAIRNLGEVQAKGQEAKSSLLGKMYQDYINQRFAGIGQAQNAAQIGEGISMGRVNAGYSAGALPRTLNTARDQAAYEEWKRSHGEESNSRLGALQSVANANTQFGTENLTIPGVSGWEKLLDIGAKVAPYAFRAMA